MDIRGQGLFSLGELSDGYRQIVALVADLARRAALLNPNAGSAAAQDATGVVLVDEIDLHLHPAWQQRVAVDLQRAFPNVQFILSTHSDQVLTTVPRDQVWALDIQPTASGAAVAWRHPDFTLARTSEEVALGAMHVNQRPSVPLSVELQEYLDLVARGQGYTEKALLLRAKLDDSELNRSGHRDPDLDLADLELRRQAWVKAVDGRTP